MKAPFNCYAIYTKLPPKTDDPDERKKFGLTAIVTAIGNDGYNIKELIKAGIAFSPTETARVFTHNEGDSIPLTIRE